MAKKNLLDEASDRKEGLLLGEEEIFSDLAGDKGSSLFLGRYSMKEVLAVLGKRNFFKESRKRNLWPLEFDLDSSEFPVQRLQIFFREKKPENLIVDLKIREGKIIPKSHLSLAPAFFDYNFLVLEWLTLQNPLLDFSEKKPPLPGQIHPGLSLGKKVLDIFVYLGRLTRKDGLLAFPAYFHNALLFTRYFQFLNPEKQGEILAIRKSFSKLPFKHLAWVVYLNCLSEEGKTYEWKAEEQVFPLNKAIKNYLDSKFYKEKVKKSLKKRQYSINWECFRKKADFFSE